MSVDSLGRVDIVRPSSPRISVDGLLLLNEESGYFRQVPGWDLNCAVVGAVLAELSLVSRIDTDMESLILLDKAATGDPILDDILKEMQTS